MHTEKAAYNADVQKFRFYQRRIFEKYLESLNGGVPLSPHAATERQFMDALRKTSDRLQSHPSSRRAGNGAGPAILYPPGRPREVAV